MVHRLRGHRSLRMPPVGHHPARPRHDRRGRRAHGRGRRHRRGRTGRIRERRVAHGRGALRRRRRDQRHRRPRLVHVQAPRAPHDHRGRAASPHDPNRGRLRFSQQHTRRRRHDTHRPAVGREHSHSEGAGDDPTVVRVHLRWHVHAHRNVHELGGVGHAEGLARRGWHVGDEADDGALRPRPLRRPGGDDRHDVHAHRVQGVAPGG